MARSKGFNLLSALSVVLVAAPCTLVAQGTTSSALTGVVRDPAGKPLAGATVRIISGAMIGGEKVARTSENGSYRFPMLAPGLYKISVETQGYPTLSGLEFLELGRTSNVNWKFQAAAAATVEVVADAAAEVNTEAVGVSTSFTSAVMEGLPTGRDLTQVAALTPGVTASDDTSGATVRAWGGDGAANAYTIDGLNVGDAKSGEKWVYANPDWFSQVSVGGLGAGAEFGGFSGAIINGVVKTGGNDLSGVLSAYYQDNSWAALRTNPRIGINQYTGVDERKLYDGTYSSYSASVGGPIIKDKLWYFISAESNTDSATDSPVGVTFPVKLSNPRYLGKLTWQVIPSATWDLFMEYDAVNRDNKYGTAQYAHEAAQRQESPSRLLTTSWTQAISSQAVLTLRFSSLSARDDRSSYNPNGYSIRLGGTGGLLANVVTAVGLSDVVFPQLINKRFAGNVNAGDLLRQNFRGRNTLSGTFDLFQNAAGSHAIRTGFEWEQSTNQEQRWIAGPGASLQNRIGVAYRASIWTDPNDPTYRELNPSSAQIGSGRDVSTRMDRAMLFAEDTWTINPSIQIRPGLRFETFKGRGFGGSTLWSTKTLAPRLGFTYNITSDQSQVLKAHVGRYYAGMSSDYFQRAIPNTYFNTGVYRWGTSTMLVDPLNPSAIPVGTLRYSQNFNNSTLNPDQKQPYTDEALLSYDIRVAKNWTVGVTGVYRAQKDILVQKDLNWDNTPGFVIDNVTVTSPVTGQTYPVKVSSRTLSDPTNGHSYYITNSDEAKNYYRMLTFSIERAMANHWSLSASMTYAGSEGNYNTSAAQDQSFADPNSQINFRGKLPYVNDREGRIRATYEFPWAWKTRISGIFTYLSGERYTPFLDLSQQTLELNQTSLGVYAAPLGSFKYPSRHLLDLKVTQDLNFSKKVRGEVFLDVFNLLNESHAYYWDTTIADDTNSVGFPSSIVITPLASYQRPYNVDNPRRARVGFKLKF